MTITTMTMTMTKEKTLLMTSCIDLTFFDGVLLWNGPNNIPGQFICINFKSVDNFRFILHEQTEQNQMRNIL